MEIYWLEQTERDVPPNNAWLSLCEAERLATMRIPKRRRDWRLGRWTAKQAIAVCLNLPHENSALAEIEVRPASSGAPEAYLSGISAPVTISISHRSGMAICAVALNPAALGCDLEEIEPRSPCFIADYFTDKEQELIAHLPDETRCAAVTLLWSAKESALKALREGLRLDTRTVEVCSLCNQLLSLRSDHSQLLPRPEWHQLGVSCSTGQQLAGWWQRANNCFRTVVASPPPSQPILMQVPRAH